jgi:hypothetical protein
MTVTDSADLRVTSELLAIHVSKYFSCSESERAAVCRLIDRAWREGHDVISERVPGGEWRQSWPEPARAALLALWSTPRVLP